MGLYIIFRALTIFPSTANIDENETLFFIVCSSAIGLCIAFCMLVFLVVYSIKNKEFLAFTLTEAFWVSFFLGSCLATVAFTFIFSVFAFDGLSFKSIKGGIVTTITLSIIFHPVYFIIFLIIFSTIFSIMKKFSQPMMLKKELTKRYFYYNLFFTFILCTVIFVTNFPAICLTYILNT